MTLYVWTYVKYNDTYPFQTDGVRMHPVYTRNISTYLRKKVAVNLRQSAKVIHILPQYIVIPPCLISHFVLPNKMLTEID